jgi:aspartate kinase
LHPEAEGTCIHNQHVSGLPPIIVYKENQALIQLSSRDYSFVGEGLTAEIYRIFEALKFRPNLTQNAAISLLCVVDDRPEKVEAFALRASEHFDVSVTKNLTMLTVRHFQQEVVEKLTTGYKIVLQQQTPETIQLVLDKKEL